MRTTAVPVDNVLVFPGVSEPRVMVLLRVPSDVLVKENASGVVPVTVMVPAVWAKAADASIMTAPSRIDNLLNEIMVPPFQLSPNESIVMGHSQSSGSKCLRMWTG